MNIALCISEIEFAMYIRQQILLNSDFGFNVSVFTLAQELLIDREKFDVVFIDTCLKDITAAKIANILRMSDRTIKLVFISDSDELVFSMLKFQPYRFIRKRYVSVELKETVRALINERQTISFNFQGQSRCIYPDEICFCEIYGHNIEIHTSKGKFRINGTLNVLENQLGPFGFFRVHKSYLVNFNYVLKLTSKDVVMSDMSILPVSRRRSPELKKAMMSMVR